MEKEKVLVIKDYKDKETTNELVKTFQDYKQAKKMLDMYKQKEQVLKEELKKYDFDKVVFQDENGIETLKIQQYITTKSNIDKEKLLEYIDQATIDACTTTKEIKNVRIIIK